MRRATLLGVFTPALIFAFMVAPPAAAAQSLWLDRGENNAFTLEILKPFFGEDSQATFATSVWFASFYLRVTPSLRLVGELPFANGGIEDSESDATIGNPYVGVEFARPGSNFFLDFGVRAPLASEDNFGTFVGLITEFTTRPDAFLPDVVTIVTAARYQLRNDQGVGFRILAAPKLAIPTEGGDSELLVNYAAQFVYDGSAAAVAAGFAGLWLVTEEGSLGENTVHELGLAGQLKPGRVQPGLEVRVPLDEDFDPADFVFGLTLTVVTD